MTRSEEEVVRLLNEAKELFCEAVEVCRKSEEGSMPRDEALRLAKHANDRASALVRRALEIPKIHKGSDIHSNGPGRQNPDHSM